MDLLKIIKEDIEKDSPDFWKELSKTRMSIREHPLEKMISDLEDREMRGSHEKNYYYKLAESLIYAKTKYPDFYKKKWKIIVQTGDDFNNPVGACAEFRALHIFERSGFRVSPIPEDKNETPDFIVHDRYDNEFYIEVFTPRMKLAAQNKLKTLKKFNQSSPAEKELPKYKSVTYRPWTETSKNHILCELCKRVLGNKISGSQAKMNQINILWINFENGDLKLRKKDLFPYVSDVYKDIYHTGSFGIWQVFYGKKNTKYFDEFTWLRYYHRIHNTLAEEDGVFRQGSKWSGAIFNLDQCLVFFQNPWAENKIKTQILESIVRMSCFDLESSWIDIEDDELIKRVNCKIQECKMIHELLEK